MAYSANMAYSAYSTSMACLAYYYLAIIAIAIVKYGLFSLFRKFGLLRKYGLFGNHGLLNKFSNYDFLHIQHIWLLCKLDLRIVA